MRSRNSRRVSRGGSVWRIEWRRSNGSWAFILVIMALTVVWSIVNMPEIAPRVGGHVESADGRPQGSSVPARVLQPGPGHSRALQGPLIMMSRIDEPAKYRAEAETDFRVNLKNEVGI